ncbi:MAG: hypothetical protein R3F34_14590 [Planctomycetota bacterium]
MHALLRRLLPLALAGTALAAPLAIRSAQDREDAASLARRYFAIADWDSNGWISLKEAGESLLASRDEFFKYDLDRDGGIDPAEFEARVRTIVETRGFFLPPIPAPRGGRELPAPTKIWFDRFDGDRSGTWDITELSAALAERDATMRVDDVLWKRLDADGSGRIEPSEMEGVLAITNSSAPTTTGATTIRELFGVPILPPPGPGVVPGPPRFAGPLPFFDRLDVDGNGSCDMRDLETLAFPAALPIRPQTLVTALDLDGDGKLDRHEIDVALGAE